MRKYRFSKMIKVPLCTVGLFKGRIMCVLSIFVVDEKKQLRICKDVNNYVSTTKKLPSCWWNISLEMFKLRSNDLVLFVFSFYDYTSGVARGGGGASSNCPMLGNLLCKDFWRWWLLPSVKNFDRNPAFKNSVEFSQISYSLIGFNRTECNLIDNRIFLYLPSAFR